MTKPKVAILGATGMLGATTIDSFARSGDFDLIATHRNTGDARAFAAQYSDVDFRLLDAGKASVEEIATAINGADWLINAIGIIKPFIHDDNSVEVERAIKTNAAFPYRLGHAAKRAGARVIQIATDCVYAGTKGDYVETDPHDPLDVYGKTKSLGEANLDPMHHLRASIIGPELKGHLSLLDWFLGQDKKATVGGYTNHQWNGVTTLHFARICQGVIKSGIELPRLQHIIPGNTIAKADLLKSFAREYRRDDITINYAEAPKVIDRTLKTANPEFNLQLWAAAGYDTPPTVEQMVSELAEYTSSKRR